MGVDLKTKEGTTAQFYVEADGVPLGKPVMLSVNSKPQTLSLDVTKVDRLQLRVKGSRGGSSTSLASGHAWWGRPILSRDPGPAMPAAAHTPSNPMPASNRTVYLAALRPVRGSATADVVLLKGKEFQNSITSSSSDKTEPVYLLNNKYETFQATVGLHHKTSEKGQVVFVLEGDGKEIRSFGPVGVNTLPLDTGVVSVKGIDQLKLRVQAYSPGKTRPSSISLIRGQAWWGEARLEKAPSTP